MAKKVRKIEGPIDQTQQGNKMYASADDLLQEITLNLKCKTAGQKTLAKYIKEKEIIICSGPAGTGKTYVACAQSLALLKNDSRFDKIVIVKSVVQLKDEEVGFLKGNLKEKMEPVVYSFIHNFEKLIGKQNTDKLHELGGIEEKPIAFMRGITLDNALIIVDEVQNVSISNIRTIMTRLGENSKMIFLGDENQIDIKEKKKSALKFLLDHFGERPEFGTIRLSDEDIVRNPLIKIMEEIFKKNLE